MSRISFFQRYSQRENHATNNILLALPYVYEVSPQKLQNVLQSLLQGNLQIGLSFAQQERGSHSVPDAVITQSRLRVYIETKTQGSLDLDQIQRHLKSIQNASENGGDRVLIGLSPERVGQELVDSMKEFANQHAIQFEAITFKDLFDTLDREFKEYETAGRAILEDLRAFLEEEGLMLNASQQLFVVPCRQSFNENLQYKVCYEPVSRPSKAACGYLGIYRDKAVRAIGRIRATVEFDPQDHQADPGSQDAVDIAAVREIIANTPYYSLGDSAHRFYFMSEFLPTEYRKETKTGMRRGRVFDLSERIGPGVGAMSVEGIAEKLKTLTWD